MQSETTLGYRYRTPTTEKYVIIPLHVQVTPKSTPRKKKTCRQDRQHFYPEDDDRRNYLENLQCSCSRSSMVYRPTAQGSDYIYTSRLEAALRRVEKASNQLREKSRQMYRNARDSIY